MPDGKVISVNKLQKVIRPFVREFWAKNLGKYASFSDLKYHAPSAEDVRRILSSLDVPSAENEIYDCDDFAFALRSHMARFARETGEFPATPCIGIGWGRFAWVKKGRLDHACNWMLGADGVFRWIEPQNLTIHSAAKCRGRLTLLLI